MRDMGSGVRTFKQGEVRVSVAEAGQEAQVRP